MSSVRVRAAAIATLFASALSAILYVLWSMIGRGSIPLLFVVISAAMIAIGIAVGEYLRVLRPNSKAWLIPNIASFLLSIPITMPYPFDIGMPICMVSTAMATGRMHELLFQTLRAQMSSEAE